jgi:ankyrin repeat protein
MKYIKLYENFEPHDPYELMIIPPNKKAEMIVREINKDEPNLNLVSDLIVLGANVDWQDEDNFNRTPLHEAAIYGNVEIARMLIDAGADLNLQTNGGRTPLHRAAYYGNVEIARILIDARANLDLQDEDGETPLHGAASWGEVEITRMLIDAGARKDIPNNSDRLPYDLTTNQELKKLLKP